MGGEGGVGSVSGSGIKDEERPASGAVLKASTSGRECGGDVGASVQASVGVVAAPPGRAGRGRKSRTRRVVDALETLGFPVDLLGLTRPFPANKTAHGGFLRGSGWVGIRHAETDRSTPTKQGLIISQTCGVYILFE